MGAGGRSPPRPRRPSQAPWEAQKKRRTSENHLEPRSYGAGRVEAPTVQNRLKIGPWTPPGVQTHCFSELRPAVATRGPPEGQLSLSQLGLL